jgi:hypothetical protein
VAAQRGHSTPEAPHTTAAGHRRAAWRDFHEKKSRLRVRAPVDPSTEYARTLRHLQASGARWGAEKNRAQSYALGTQGVGGSAQGAPTGPLAASPRPHSPGCGRAAGTPQRERFAHAEGSGHTNRKHGLVALALWRLPPPPPPSQMGYRMGAPNQAPNRSCGGGRAEGVGREAHPRPVYTGATGYRAAPFRFVSTEALGGYYINRARTERASAPLRSRTRTATPCSVCPPAGGR